MGDAKGSVESVGYWLNRGEVVLSAGRSLVFGKYRYVFRGTSAIAFTIAELALLQRGYTKEFIEDAWNRETWPPSD